MSCSKAQSRNQMTIAHAVPKSQLCFKSCFGCCIETCFSQWNLKPASAAASSEPRICHLLYKLHRTSCVQLLQSCKGLKRAQHDVPWKTWDTKECIGRTHGTSEAKRMNLWNETAERMGASWERPNSTQMSKRSTNTTLEKRVRVYPDHQRSISNENFSTSKDNTMFGVESSAPQSQISKGASRSIGASFRETKN